MLDIVKWLSGSASSGGVSSFDCEWVIVGFDRFDESDVVVQFDDGVFERVFIDTEALRLFHVGCQDDWSPELKRLDKSTDKHLSFMSTSGPDFDVVDICAESIGIVVSVDCTEDDGSDFLSADTCMRGVSDMVGENLERGQRFVNYGRKSERTDFDRLTEVLD